MAASGPVDESLWRPETSRLKPALVVHHERTGAVAEQYRAARTWLSSHNATGEHRVVAITSSRPGEGRTITTGNLGLAFAEIKHLSILLVDAHLRRPGLADLFGITPTATHAGSIGVSPGRIGTIDAPRAGQRVAAAASLQPPASSLPLTAAPPAAVKGLQPSPGLADVLAGRASLDEALMHPQHRVLPNLTVLPAGDLGEQLPSGLLSTRTAGRLFDEIRERYHYVLVDTPAVEGASDIGVIGAWCTGVVLVVRMFRTPSAVAKKSVRWLQANNLHVLGCLAVAANAQAGSLGDGDETG